MVWVCIGVVVVRAGVKGVVIDGVGCVRLGDGTCTGCIVQAGGRGGCVRCVVWVGEVVRESCRAVGWSKDVVPLEWSGLRVE